MAKYYHYRIWIEDDAGERLDPTEVLSGDVFSEDERVIESFPQV